MPTRKDNLTKKDLEDLKTEMIHQFHMISEGLIDQIKLLAEGHSGIIEKLTQHDNRFEGIETRLDRVGVKLDAVETRLDRVETGLDKMGKENERQHLETRALVKLSFSELDKRLSTVESQLKELQEWRKQVEARFQL